jgi:uncharacterized protein (TIGR02594 family)
MIITLNTPKHIAVAVAFIGTKEVVGVADNPVILGWLKTLKAWWSNDSTPWCGAFVANALITCNLPIISTWYRALDWGTYNTECKIPNYGCIGVLKRKGGGHVCFIVGQTTVVGELYYLALGGNQGDSVSIVTIKAADFLCFRSVPDAMPKQAIPVFKTSEIAALKKAESFA